MPRTLDEIISELSKLNVKPVAIAASTNPPSPAELRQAENFVAGIRSAVDSAIDRPKAEKMLQVAVQAASERGVGRSVVGIHNRTQADEIAYLEGQLSIIEQAGCSDGAMEIRIRDNLRSLRGTR